MVQSAVPESPPIQLWSLRWAATRLLPRQGRWASKIRRCRRAAKICARAARRALLVSASRQRAASATGVGSTGAASPIRVSELRKSGSCRVSPQLPDSLTAISGLFANHNRGICWIRKAWGQCGMEGERDRSPRHTRIVRSRHPVCFVAVAKERGCLVGILARGFVITRLPHVQAKPSRPGAAQNAAIRVGGCRVCDSNCQEAQN